MDIEKDSNREAFELVVANKLQNSLYHSVFFNEATGRYDCADDAPAGVQVFCFDLNSDFRIWQAAKAQANKQFANFIDQAIEDSACADERRSLQALLDEFQDISMIESQEPAND